MPTRQNQSRRAGVIAGCLIALVIVVVLIAACGVFVAMNWRDWAADLSVQGVEAMLDKSELSEEQRSAIMVKVTDLADEFKDGDVTLEQMKHVGQEIVNGPIIPVAAVYGARKQYIDKSGLSEEEKANADLQMQRLARGVFEKKVSIDELEDAVDQIAVRTRENQWELRDPKVVDDGDVREMITKITALADEKQIPVEPFQVDIAAEVSEAIDRGLGRLPPEPEPATQPAEQPATQTPPADPTEDNTTTDDDDSGGG